MEPAVEVPELIRLRRVQQITGKSRSDIYRLIRAGRFPAPIPKEQGERASLWLLSEVVAYVLARVAQRGNRISESNSTRDVGGRFERLQIQ